MRVAVAIVPRLLMTVVAARRNQLIQNGRQVMLQSWLELNRTDCRRATDIENVDCPQIEESYCFPAATLLRLPDLLHIPTWRGSKETAVFAAEL